MALRIAIGSYRPWLLPEVYPTSGNAILNAKAIFEILQKKPEISVWDTADENVFTVASGTCIAKVNRKSYDGVYNLSTPAIYPTEREPGDTDNPADDPGYTFAEVLSASDAISAPTNTEYFGPFQVDGDYVVDYCGDTISVYYDVEGVGHYDGSQPLAVGPLGLSEIPPFRWKYKAVPFGLDAGAVDWSEPTGPQYTFVGLIPGMEYTFYYTDAAEEIEG